MIKEDRFIKDFNEEKIFCLEYDKETLKDMVLEKQEEIERLQDMDKILRNENINLKLRINKAIEYIKNNAMYSESEKICCDDLYTTDCDKLLEILDKAKSDKD